jgi:hypothetical protein
VSQRRATPDAALPEELRTAASARDSPTPNPVAVRLMAGNKVLVTIRGWRYVLTRPWQYFKGHAYLTKMAARLDFRRHRRLATIERLAARTGSARTDRSGSARTVRKERDAKQRAATAASGQALPAQLQRRSRRQSVCGLRPTSGDEGE